MNLMNIWMKVLFDYIHHHSIIILISIIIIRKSSQVRTDDGRLCVVREEEVEVLENRPLLACAHRSNCYHWSNH